MAGNALAGGGEGETMLFQEGFFGGAMVGQQNLEPNSMALSRVNKESCSRSCVLHMTVLDMFQLFCTRSRIGIRCNAGSRNSDSKLWDTGATDGFHCLAMRLIDSKKAR